MNSQDANKANRLRDFEIEGATISFTIHAEERLKERNIDLSLVVDALTKVHNNEDLSVCREFDNARTITINLPTKRDKEVITRRALFVVFRKVKRKYIIITIYIKNKILMSTRRNSKRSKLPNTQHKKNIDKKAAKDANREIIEWQKGNIDWT